MSVQDTWLQHLKLIVDREAGGTGPRARRQGYRAVASATGFDEEYIYQLYQAKAKPNGRLRAVSVDMARALARAYADGRPLDWIDHPVNGMPTHAAEEPPPYLTWPLPSISPADYRALPPAFKRLIDRQAAAAFEAFQSTAAKETPSTASADRSFREAFYALLDEPMLEEHQALFDKFRAAVELKTSHNLSAGLQIDKSQPKLKVPKRQSSKG